MVVGYLQGQEAVRDHLTTVACKYLLNPVTATFVMKTVDEKSVKNFRNWFGDVQMIGKHFLIYSKAIRDVKRHYTICNVMIPENMSELISLSRSVVNNEQVNFNRRLFSDVDQNSICVTVKNYKGP